MSESVGAGYALAPEDCLRSMSQPVLLGWQNASSHLGNYRCSANTGKKQSCLTGRYVLAMVYSLSGRCRALRTFSSRLETRSRDSPFSAHPKQYRSHLAGSSSYQRYQTYFQIHRDPTLQNRGLCLEVWVVWQYFHSHSYSQSKLFHA